MKKRQKKKIEKQGVVQEIKQVSEGLGLFNPSKIKSSNVSKIEKEIKETVTKRYGDYNLISKVAKGEANGREVQKAITKIQDYIKKDDPFGGTLFNQEKKLIKDELKSGLSVLEIEERIKNGYYIEDDVRQKYWESKRKNPKSKLKYTKQELKEIENIKSEIKKFNPLSSTELDAAAKAYANARLVKGYSKEEALDFIKNTYLDSTTGAIKYI